MHLANQPCARQAVADAFLPLQLLLPAQLLTFHQQHQLAAQADLAAITNMEVAAAATAP
jgi:hypothetical protein